MHHFLLYNNQHKKVAYPPYHDSFYPHSPYIPALSRQQYLDISSLTWHTLFGLCPVFSSKFYTVAWFLITSSATASTMESVECVVNNLVVWNWATGPLYSKIWLIYWYIHVNTVRTNATGWCYLNYATLHTDNYLPISKILSSQVC